MCGIVGVVGKVEPETLVRMCRVMAHRGPDDEGVFVNDGGSVGLGMRRLSIIDLAGGRQPVHNEDKTVWIVFNGEVYNYRELREWSEKKGHRYYTNSDTETIVHLYEEFGAACVHLLRAMFAFAIYDGREKGKVFVARDRLGVKPLYYWQGNGKLIFASEIKAILEHPEVPREPDFAALDMYLTLQYVPAPLTMFKGIFKLPPGHTLVAQNGNVKVEHYWDVDYCEAERVVDPRDAAQELFAFCEEAVRLRLIADVPLGALLSGGVDSSTVVALMSRQMSQPVKTFTVGFDVGRGYNELAQARKVAAFFGTDHHEVVLTAPQAQELLPKLVWHLDEPLADRAALPTYLICQYARQFVKVVLTGEGGDEVLGGYPRYGWFRLATRLQRWLPPFVREKLLLKGLGRLVPSERRRKHLHLLLSGLADAERHLQWVGNFTEEEKYALYRAEMHEQVAREWQGARDEWQASSLNGEPVGGLRDLVNRYLKGKAESDLIHALMYLDVKTWLVDDILTKVDKMSMACALEARVPLLDYKLVEFVATLPTSLKTRNLGTKWLMRGMMSGVLPDDVLSRKKHPFSVPASEWFRGELLTFAKELLLSEETATKDYFNRAVLGELLERHRSERSDLNQHIWNLLCLELWHRLFINRSVSCS